MRRGVDTSGILTAGGAAGAAPGRGWGMRGFCSWSGGKDSALALHRARADGVVVERLLTMMIEDGARSRSHGLRTEVLRAQADAMGLPITFVPTSWDDYEARFVEAVAELRADGLTEGVFGDIDIDRNRAWVEGVCGPAGVTVHEPLWGRPRRGLLGELLRAGFRAHVVAVRADVCVGGPERGRGQEGGSASERRELLGRELDADLVDTLAAAGIDPSGELGEYHTVVAAGPELSRPLDLVFGEVVERSGYRFVDVVVR